MDRVAIHENAHNEDGSLLRHAALLERVAKLERALEEIDRTLILFGSDASLDYIQETAQKALSD
jgi:hypothetical protein